MLETRGSGEVSPSQYDQWPTSILPQGPFVPIASKIVPEPPLSQISHPDWHATHPNLAVILLAYLPFLLPCKQVLNETRDRLATAIQEAMTDPREMECQEIISKILELQRSTVEDKDARLKREMELTSLREVRV